MLDQCNVNATKLFYAALQILHFLFQPIDKLPIHSPVSCNSNKALCGSLCMGVVFGFNNINGVPPSQNFKITLALQNAWYPHALLSIQFTLISIKTQWKNVLALFPF